MQASMLLNNCPAVDAYDFPVRKGFADDAHRLLVQVGLVVGWHQDGTVDDQVVGIGGRKAGIVLGGSPADCSTFGRRLLVDGAGQREAQQAVGLAVKGAQVLQFLFHFVEVGVV